MSLFIPDDILYATRMSEEEMRQEIAVMLYQKGKLSLGQASTLATMHRIQIQYILASN